MTPAQFSLFLVAHVLLACALSGARGDMPALLSAGCALASLLGLATAVGNTPRRRP